MTRNVGGIIFKGFCGWYQRNWLATLLSLLFTARLLVPVPISAQSVTATLRGTVTDTTGAAVVGAGVTLSEPSTGQLLRQAVSSSTGDYEFDQLQPGTYVLRCSMPGFKAFEAQNIVLDPGQIRRVDPSMTVGASTAQTVVVSAGASVINTESATISATFTGSQNDRAPLINVYPSVFSIMTSAPGVQGGYGSFPVMDGEQQTQQTQSFDGIPNDVAGDQTDNSNFFEQTSAQTFNAPAESAVPGAIELITHRGGNDIHGVASYKIYDSVLNASGYFPPPKTPYLQHEWNIGVGGPILKNKAFFYGEWFAQRIPLGTPSIISVPTPAMRQGVFSQTITDPQTGAPFPNNTIPANRISSVSLAAQNTFYPVPVDNYANMPPVDNYPFEFPFNSDLYRGDWPLARVDYNLTKNNTVFVRWLLRTTPYVLNDGVPSAIWTRVRTNQQWAIGDTQIFSPNLDNNFRLGIGFDDMKDGQPERGITPPNGATVLSSIGLQGANPGNSNGQGLPTISISGLTSIADIPGGQKMNNRILTVTDAADWQRGRHVLKFGFMLQRYHNAYGFVNNYGSFSFDGSVTGNAYADFLLGIPQSTTRTNPLTSRTQDVGNWAIYAQDDYRVNNRLTLNYGVRWDYYTAPYASDHRMYNWDPTTGNVIVDPAGNALVSPLYPSSITVVPGQVRAISDKTNITPRIGAAFRLSEHQVLRGGYGVYTARLDGASFGNGPGTYNPFELINPQLGSTGPFSITQSYRNVVNTGQTPLLQFPNPYPGSASQADVPSQTAYGYPRNESLGRIQQFNATYEREINKVGLRASYLGSRSSGLNYQVNIDLPHPSTTPFTSANLPYPQFYQTYMTYYNGGAKYDSLQFEALRRAGSLTFDANYTLQRSIANYLDTENPYDVLSHWANDGPTMRHYAVINASWTLPFGSGQRFFSHTSGFAEKMAGGWTVTALSYMGSGIWYSPLYSGADPSNTGTFGGLPDKVGNPHSFPGGKSRLEAFNPSAFAIPQNGSFGNAKPNSLEGQRLYLIHLGIVKETPITDRVKFHLNTQISNLLNHAEFLPPGGDITVPGGNLYTSQLGTFSSLERGTQRQITFQGAFRF